MALLSVTYTTRKMAPRKSGNQASRSSLRVAKARSLRPVGDSKATLSKELAVPPANLTTKCMSPPTQVSRRSRSPELQDASKVPRLDKPWVMYDLSGKPFVINPVAPGMVD